MRTTTKLSVLTIGCAMIGGCASTTETERIPRGSVAVVAAQYAPASDFNAYAQGRGANAITEGGTSALKGARIGAGVAGFVPALVTQLLTPVPPLAAMGLAVTVVAAAAGGVVGGVIGGTAGVVGGAVNGLPSDQVKVIHEPVERARRDAAIQTALSQHVLALGGDLPEYRLSYLPELGPTSSGQRPDYQALKGQGYEGVLELAVASIGFEATPGDPPTAIFKMTLGARAVSLTTDVKPWIREQTYRGNPRTLPDWQADEGQLLQEELDASYRSLAQFVATAMFDRAPLVAQALEPSRPPLPVIVSSLAPAATVGAALPAVGDTWTYRLTDSKRSRPQSHRVTIVSVTSDAVVEQLGEDRQPARTRPMKGGYLMRQDTVSLFSPYFAAFESLEPGTQIAKIENLDPDFCTVSWICSITARVGGSEIVRVPAGEFEAIKVEVNHSWTSRHSQGEVGGGRTLTVWYSPQTKRAVKFSSRGSNSSFIESHFDLELQSYALN